MMHADFCPWNKGECYGRACSLWVELPERRGCALRIAAEALADLVEVLAVLMEEKKGGAHA